MVIVKRLYTFMLQRFLPLLAMTFFICLFIVLMQFLWRHIEDLVGKGLSVDVIGELFFYASLTMVPLSLPLAVLLASLMVFGNLGEKFELTAIKAAGISLIKIMKPLIIFMVFLAIGAFFFQNNVLPVAQTKMWTLLFSMRQKSPEVEIPERGFYDQIPGMNLYIEKKNRDTGMLYGMIMYDISRGLDNSRVILADSGKMNFTEDKKHLFLHLYNGEMFENLRDNDMGSSSSNYLPFRRESFLDKKIYFVFDANFNRMDESTMRNQYVGKNIAELQSSIDSIQHVVDSIGDNYANDIVSRPYAQVVATSRIRMRDGVIVVKRMPFVAGADEINLDTVFAGESPGMAKSYINSALNRAKRQRQDYEFRSAMLTEQAKNMRRHDIEMQRKFTLSFACLIFFFIGAPLGAIIKKGGIGTPLVISVFLFIIYYIFDNMGYKMARDGKTEVWLGIWLSSMVLLPMGVFFTYKAVGDSQVFNPDIFNKIVNFVLRKRPTRNLIPKEVIITEVNIPEARVLIQELIESLPVLREASQKKRIQRILHPYDYSAVEAKITKLVDYLSNSPNPRIVGTLNQYPIEVRATDLETIETTTAQIIKLLNNQEEREAKQTQYGTHNQT